MSRSPGFDFAIIPSTLSSSEIVGLIELGEGLGYRNVWIPDQGFQRDPFSLLTAAATRTNRIGLGIGIASPFTRLPVQIARATATIDEMSQGRFRLGIGTANVAKVLMPLGIAFGRPVGRLRDAFVILRRLLDGQEVSFHGASDHLESVQLELKTPRAIPIYIGTRGAQTLTLAGEVADGVLVESLFNGGGMPHAMRRLGMGAQRAGRPLQDIDVVSWQLVMVTDDPAATIEAHRSWIVRAVQTGPTEAMEMIGVDPEVIRSVLTAPDPSAARAAITDDAARCLMIVGQPEAVGAAVSRTLDSGATSISMLLMGSADEIADRMQRFAQQVMPEFSTRSHA